MAPRRVQTNGLITGITLIALGIVGTLVLITAGVGGFGPGSDEEQVWPGTESLGVPWFSHSQTEPADFSSLGEQIYYTGRGEDGRVIPRSEGMMHMNACVDCHGRDARGGTARIMMESFETPSIRWSALAGEDHEGDHPPYDAERFARALREGVDPGGETLDRIMPRWDLTGEEIDALVDYLDGF